MAEKKVKKREFKELRKHLTLRNLLMAGIVIVIYLMFSNLAKAIIFMILFVPISTVGVKVSRMFPYGNVDFITPFSFFLGYLYGWPVGVFFGVVIGVYIFSTAYSISQFIILHLVLNAQVAILGHYFANSFTVWQFGTAYLIAMGIRNLFYFAIGSILGSPTENTIQTVAAIIVNMIFLPSIMVLIYKLAILI